ncbi:hypothetical protein F4774DRAFT_413193 [Daldinia eschscholtzii]|nr:hypothetical protein F4774DRAFT_413193 [Daldinia eschscholtzii]
MSPPPRTPSPQPGSPLEIPSYTTQLRALSLDTDDDEFDHGNLEPASPASRALLTRHYEGLQSRSDNTHHRHEFSPFDSPTTNFGSNSASRGRLEKGRTGSYTPTFIPTIRITSPGSPSPSERGGRHQSHLSSTPPTYTSMNAREEDPARRFLEKEFHDLESSNSATGPPHNFYDPMGRAQLPGRETSPRERTISSAKKQNALPHGDAKIRHDGQKSEKSVARSGESRKGDKSPVCQEPTNDNTKKQSPAPGTSGFVNYKYPRYPPLVHPLRAHPVHLPPGAPPLHSTRREDETK